MNMRQKGAKRAAKVARRKVRGIGGKRRRATMNGFVSTGTPSAYFAVDYFRYRLLKAQRAEARRPTAPTRVRGGMRPV